MQQTAKTTVQSLVEYFQKLIPLDKDEKVLVLAKFYVNHQINEKDISYMQYHAYWVTGHCAGKPSEVDI